MCLRTGSGIRAEALTRISIAELEYTIVHGSGNGACCVSLTAHLRHKGVVCRSTLRGDRTERTADFHCGCGVEVTRTTRGGVQNLSGSGRMAFHVPAHSTRLNSGGAASGKCLHRGFGILCAHGSRSRGSKHTGMNRCISNSSRSGFADNASYRSDSAFSSRSTMYLVGVVYARNLGKGRNGDRRRNNRVGIDSVDVRIGLYGTTCVIHGASAKLLRGETSDIGSACFAALRVGSGKCSGCGVGESEFTTTLGKSHAVITSSVPIHELVERAVTRRSKGVAELDGILTILGNHGTTYGVHHGDRSRGIGLHLVCQSTRGEGGITAKAMILDISCNASGRNRCGGSRAGRSGINICQRRCRGNGTSSGSGCRRRGCNGACKHPSSTTQSESYGRGGGSCRSGSGVHDRVTDLHGGKSGFVQTIRTDAFLRVCGEGGSGLGVCELDHAFTMGFGDISVVLAVTGHQLIISLGIRTLSGSHCAKHLHTSFVAHGSIGFQCIHCSGNSLGVGFSNLGQSTSREGIAFAVDKLLVVVVGLIRSVSFRNRRGEVLGLVGNGICICGGGDFAIFRRRSIGSIFSGGIHGRSSQRIKRILGGVRVTGTGGIQQFLKRRRFRPGSRSAVIHRSICRVVRTSVVEQVIQACIGGFFLSCGTRIRVIAILTIEVVSALGTVCGSSAYIRLVIRCKGQCVLAIGVGPCNVHLVTIKGSACGIDITGAKPFHSGCFGVTDIFGKAAVVDAIKSGMDGIAAILRCARDDGTIPGKGVLQTFQAAGIMANSGICFRRQTNSTFAFRKFPDAGSSGSASRLGIGKSRGLHIHQGAICTTNGGVSSFFCGGETVELFLGAQIHLFLLAVDGPAHVDAIFVFREVDILGINGTGTSLVCFLHFSRHIFSAHLAGGHGCDGSRIIDGGIAGIEELVHFACHPGILFEVRLLFGSQCIAGFQALRHVVNHAIGVRHDRRFAAAESELISGEIADTPSNNVLLGFQGCVSEIAGGILSNRLLESASKSGKATAPVTSLGSSKAILNTLGNSRSRCSYSSDASLSDGCCGGVIRDPASNTVDSVHASTEDGACAVSASGTSSSASHCAKTFLSSGKHGSHTHACGHKLTAKTGTGRRGTQTKLTKVGVDLIGDADKSITHKKNKQIVFGGIEVIEQRRNHFQRPNAQDHEHTLGNEHGEKALVNAHGGLTCYGTCSQRRQID